MIAKDFYVTSSFCSGGDCLEVGYQTSSFCGGSNCVEVAMPAAKILVRDTKDRSLAPVAFSPGAWTAFLTGVRAREFGGSGD